jgi:hypothetical protein
MGLDQILARVRDQSATRTSRFLSTIESLVYGHRQSPYRALLRQAGCELGDVRRMVEIDGLEGALHRLAAAGVYVTFDEMKGRRRIVRGSFQLETRGSDFDNPVVAPHILMHTSGSGGRPGRILRSLRNAEDVGTTIRLLAAARGIRNPEIGFWWPSAGQHLIAARRAGMPAPMWFYPVHPLPWPVWVAAVHQRLVGALAGHAFPLPHRGDLERPTAVLNALLNRVRGSRTLLFQTMPSAAARLSTEAARRGVRLDGVVFIAIGEPITPARRDAIANAGAGLITMYGSVEMPAMGGACGSPDVVDDVHVMTNLYAIIQRERVVGTGGPRVEALLLSNLDVHACKVSLNAESGDFARMASRRCGCLLDELGLTTHLSDIRSFEKLTSEGVTFARSRLEEIVELELPSRFGGTGIDYQLAEEEAEHGLSRLVMRVSPSVGTIDEEQLRATLLAALSSEGMAAAYNASMWRNVGILEVRRESPRPTRAGKVLPLQPLTISGR